eukprot:5335684-Alexandrium_andersonii.AAC.1
MSASLVGSEMCIRDRLTERIGQMEVGGKSSSSGMCTPWSGLGTLYKAVSYTHLTLPTICSV